MKSWRRDEVGGKGARRLQLKLPLLLLLCVADVTVAAAAGGGAGNRHRYHNSGMFCETFTQKRSGKGQPN